MLGQMRCMVLCLVLGEGFGSCWGVLLGPPASVPCCWCMALLDGEQTWALGETRALGELHLLLEHGSTRLEV